jgi:hypothetical protein
LTISIVSFVHFVKKDFSLNSGVDGLVVLQFCLSMNSIQWTVSVMAVKSFCAFPLIRYGRISLST